MSSTAASPPARDVLATPEAGGMLIRGSALRGVGFVVTLALSLASAPLLPRYLGLAEFGRYSQIVALVAIVGAVSEAGISALVVRELARLDDAESRRRLMREVLGLRLVLTGSGVGLAVVFVALAGYGGALVAGTALAGVGLVLYGLQGAFALPLAAQLRLGWITASELVKQVVFVGLVVGLVIAGAGIVPLLAAPIGAGLVATAVVLWPVRGSVPRWPVFDARAWRSMLRQTLPIALAAALYTVYFRIVLLLLSSLTGDLEVGYYALSFRVLEVLVAVPYLLVGSALPLLTRAARDDQARLRYAFGRMWEISLIAGSLLALVTFVAAPSVIAFLDDGAGPVPVGALRIQALTLLAVFLNVAYGTALIALRRHRELVLANALALTVIVVLALAVVPSLGAQGAAWVTTLGELFLVGAYALALRRVRPDLSPRLRILPRVAVAAVGAFAASVVIEIPVVPNLASAAAAAVVFVTVLAALRGVPPEVVDALLRRRRAPLEDSEA